MADGIESKPMFEPVHKAHAIEQVAIGLTFDRELDDDSLRAVSDKIGTPSELPGRTEVRGISIAIGVNAPTAPASGRLSGLLFRRVRPDGVTEAEFQAMRSLLVFRTMLYTRWDDVWAQARRCFVEVLPIYLSNIRLMQTSLNYMDKFVCNAAVDQCQPSSILRKDSPYLSPQVFSAKDLWHSHTGSFGTVDDRTKRLISVNTDFITETQGDKERGALTIRTALVNMFNLPGYKPVPPGVDEAIKSIDVSFHQLHEQAILVLKGIIDPEMARRIALEG